MSLKFIYDDSHSPDDVYSIALVHSGESRIVIENLFNKINPYLLRLSQQPKFRFHFCSDLKFLALTLGIQQANSNYFCPWCSCSKISKNYAINLPKYSRSFSNMKVGCCPHCDNASQLGKCTNKNHGINGENLLLKEIFSMERVWLDPLHITLRITDRIEKVFLREVNKKKKIPDVSREMKLQCNLNVKPYKSNTKQRNLEVWKMPMLNGSDKKKIFKNFRDFTPFFNHTNSLIWKRIFELVNYIIIFVNGDDSIINLTQYSNYVWELKNILRKKFYNECWIPYFHCVEVHVPQQISKSPFFTIGPFSLSGQEAKHKFQTITQFRASNHRSYCKKILVHEYANVCK